MTVGVEKRGVWSSPTPTPALFYPPCSSFPFSQGEVPRKLDGDLAMGVLPKLLSLLYVACNQLLLFVYIPWLHRHLFQPSPMTYIARTLPYASIVTTAIELFVVNVDVVRAFDGVVCELEGREGGGGGVAAGLPRLAWPKCKVKACRCNQLHHDSAWVVILCAPLNPHQTASMV